MDRHVCCNSISCLFHIAMAGDVIHGIRRKKLWFPCKYFSMNAASLTVIAVAMKLSVDLTTAMWGTIDTLAKLSSSGFMIIVMGNFLISFASMNNKEIFMNIVALGILVITISVNMGIQLYTWREDLFGMYILRIFNIVSMLVLFVTMISSILTIPATKRDMEKKYNELHENVCEGGKSEETENLTDEKLTEVVEKYWVMAETGSPQFVMARSVTSAMLGAICLATTIFFVTLAIAAVLSDGGLKGYDSTYRWSTVWIFMIQSIGVVVGTIAPICRWFTAINFNCNNMFNNHHKEFKLVETFWIQRLVEWKEARLPSQIRGMKCKRVIGNVKILVLKLSICIQIWIVGKRIMKVDLGSESIALETKNSSPKLDLYVLRLEGEPKLPKSILKNMCYELNQLIQMGKSRQPQNLLELLRKSNNSFKGVVDFDSNQVQYCWTLPVVTLTSIAIALPGIENHMVKRLMGSVSEGLRYASLVEESFSYKGDDLLNLKCAADVVWAGVELNGKWLDKNLRKHLLKGRTMEGTRQTLADIAEKATIEFQRNLTGGPKVLAANSMSTISQTILNDYKCSTDPHVDRDLFEKLSIMTADILGACLTNLPRVIIRKCYCSAIEERDKSVRRAARLLGEIEAIRGILKHHELPRLSGDQAAYIDEWCSYMMQKDPHSLVPSSNNEISAFGSGELHINVAK
ncbi:hypothetical protein RHSIM_Rhsim04G0106900 [Rhododendron simsii]|uniref:Uncharacterized protein n=1 Tax=Rhododendron simsii TaxID=118357 RepID=A0A834LN23_RHOSS|nr:hypothetical protein RHSIM_Rhsim04G0106900 [Rhododendron simsii]